MANFQLSTFAVRTRESQCPEPKVDGCATSPKANSLFSATDLKFAEEMIPHHEQAVLMSDIALTNSAAT